MISFKDVLIYVVIRSTLINQNIFKLRSIKNIENVFLPHEVYSAK